MNDRMKQLAPMIQDRVEYAAKNEGIGLKKTKRPPLQRLAISECMDFIKGEVVKRVEAWEKEIRKECESALSPVLDAVVVAGSLRDLALLEEVLLGTASNARR